MMHMKKKEKKYMKKKFTAAAMKQEQRLLRRVKRVLVGNQSGLEGTNVTSFPERMRKRDADAAAAAVHWGALQEEVRSVRGGFMHERFRQF